MEVGQTAVFKRQFSQSDFDRFAALSGDDNPIHVDAEFSARTRFGRTVCHGMLLYSCICQVLSAQLPGPGAVQVEQTLMFPTPTFTGEEVTIRLEVLEKLGENGTAVLDTKITRPGELIACEGQTIVGMSIVNLHPQESSDPEPKPSEAQVFRGLRLGQRAVIKRLFIESDLAEYVDLTGDANPLYADAGYARKAGLNGPMIPGGLLGGLFSYLLGTELPGRGTNWLKQRLVFIRPAYPGQEITAEVKVKRLRPEKELVNLSTRCTNPAGELVCSGEALVLVKDLEVKM